jgi:hypothetical protein
LPMMTSFRTAMRPALGIAFALMFLSQAGYSQPKTENIILITLDGFRWQEVFAGMDTSIANQRQFHHGDSAYLYQHYWSPKVQKRREQLLPFLWATIGSKGQLYGNRLLGNKVDAANPYWFSYPGYNEIFTGYPDEKVNSNSYPNNPNTNVLEFINRQPGFVGRVAAFAAWDAFTRILNTPRCGFPVVAAFDDCGGATPTATEALINAMRRDSYKPWHMDECLDVFTHYAAVDWLKTRKPRLLYIGYGETDEWAHAANYKAYLDAAHQDDQWMRDVWDFIQNEPQYKDKTTMIVTVDHGRGDKQKQQWTGHGQSVFDSHETWFGIIGPDTEAKGEVTDTMQVYEKQYAQTIASLLGLVFTADHPIGARIEAVQIH